MDDRDLKYIDDYLEDRLSDTERKKLESRLNQEPELFEEFTFRKSTFQFLLKEKTGPQLKATLEGLGTKYFDSSPKTINGKKTNKLKLLWFAATAAAIILLLIAQPWESTNLYSKHGAHATLALVEKSDNIALFQEAEKYFNSRDYKNARAPLETILSDAPSNHKVILALGICALEQNEFTTAESFFDQLIQSNSTFKEYGLWYMALSSLKQDDQEKTISYLDQITAKNDSYLEKKKTALLNDLK